ncbi:MAG TPA: acyltransferase [Stellaceae bacterium]|jgi:peptidoglycan/LPS O-acetylase OafA/YrhL
MAVIPFGPSAPLSRDHIASIPQSRTAERANNFDSLRLVAALSVMFSHSFLIAEGSEAHEWFVRLSGNQCVLGLVGVFVFFVISGYLVTASYCRHPRPGRFALHRVLRIFPGLIVNLLVCAFALGPLVTSLSGHDYFASGTLYRYLGQSFLLSPNSPPLPGVTFVDNAVGNIVNGSLWTLRYEMMMYAMVLLLGLAGLLRLSTTLLLTALGIVAVAFENSLKPFGDFGEMAWLLGFFASGMAMHFLRPYLSFRWPYMLLAVAVLAGFVWLHVFIMLFPLAGAYLVIGFATRHDPGLDYSRHLGDLSYGLYIYGWPAENLVVWLSHGHAAWWQVFLGAVAIAGPLAYLSWHLVESRALAWGRRPPAHEAMPYSQSTGP